jgi:hypothetical protein
MIRVSYAKRTGLGKLNPRALFHRNKTAPLEDSGVVMQWVKKAMGEESAYSAPSTLF